MGGRYEVNSYNKEGYLGCIWSRERGTIRVNLTMVKILRKVAREESVLE